MQIKELLNILNIIAPFKMQEAWDNSGFIFGDETQEVSKILISLDVTENTLNEAKKVGANTILAHHPLIFQKVFKITKEENPLLFEAVRSGLNIIAYHTNFDASGSGLNHYIAGKLLNLKDLQVIDTTYTETFYKIAVYTPEDYVEKVREALFESGAGFIGNYSKASFNIEGVGTFMPQDQAKPFLGKQGEFRKVNEIKIETVISEFNLEKAIKRIKEVHPYEEVAYDVYKLENFKNFYGFGLIGSLDKEITLRDFIEEIKKAFKTDKVRFVALNFDEAFKRKVKRIAVVSGSGAMFIRKAKNLGADCFITGDVSYHQALDATTLNLPVIEVNHFETEKFFKEALKEALDDFSKNYKKQLPGLILTTTDTSPFVIL